VYHSGLKSLYGMLFFNLHSCILFISIFIILTNVDTLITLYFYFCRWNLKKREKIEEINKTFVQITQVMEVARALTTILAKNDDQYIWISIQVVVFFEIIVCENQTFCL
jgi:flagellar basal body-associated protein FliL